MAGNRPNCRTQALRGRHILPVLGAILLFLPACRSGPPDTLTVESRVALPDSSARHFRVDSTGTAWIAARSGILPVDSRGTPGRMVALRTAEPVDWMDVVGNRIHFHAGGTLGALEVDPFAGRLPADTLAIYWPDSPADALAAAPDGAFVLRSHEHGTIVAHDGRTLAPVWGWAANGRTAGAITFSPGGERLFQALGAGERGDPELLVHDVQTGRIVYREALPGAVTDIDAGLDGTLFLATREGGEGGRVLALGWSEGRLETVWSRSVGDLGLDSPIRLRASPSGRLLAVLAAGNETGLRILDAEAGVTIDRLGGIAFDVDFDPLDRILLLSDGELLRLR